MDFQFVREHLEKAGVVFESGLSKQECDSLENEFDFCLPPDLRGFLSFGLPISDGWVNWRTKNRNELLDKLNWPCEGICFDVEHNDFWLQAWGKKAADLEDRFQVVRKLIGVAPKLIPIYGHRYIADRPRQSENPIFSVYQTDIICYGSNIQEYFENEYWQIFKTPEYSLKGPIKNIEFWSGILKANNGLA